MIEDILFNFLSPVTGRVICDLNYVLIGNDRDIAVPSPFLLDLSLDFINLRKHYNTLTTSDIIIGHSNHELPNAQVLSNLTDGVMYTTAGIVSTVDVKSFAPADATYILQQPNLQLTKAQALSNLSGGILKSAALTGVISIALGGQNILTDDYVTPFDLAEQIKAAETYADTVAAAAETAAIAASTAYFTYQMLPFVPSPAPLSGVGYQISAAIAVVAAAAAHAQSTADNANIRIDNLTVTLVGDVTAHDNIANPIGTTFAPNPVFTGTESMTIPGGYIYQRPSNPNGFLLRYIKDMQNLN